MYNILIDSGFWFALYSSRDQYHNLAKRIVADLEINNIVIPFPTLYESINTEFMKNPVARTEFDNVLKRKNVTVIDDESIKYDALRITFEESSKRRNLSLVDNIIRLILSDRSYKIDYFVTFNKADFIDVCNNQRINILDS